MIKWKPFFGALIFLAFSLETAGAEAQIIRVISPAYGADVRGTVKIRVTAPGRTDLRARCWHQPDGGNGNPLGYEALLPDCRIDAEGNGVVTFRADEYPHGPVTIILSVRGDSCFLQLYNTGGVSWMEGLAAAPAPPAAKGMKVVFADDFSRMPSISHSGAGAVYASRKPDDTEFGDAIFADREGPYNPFSQRDTYLEITTMRRPGITDPEGWHRTYTTGFLSSERTDGTGFHTTGGHAQYFECRFAVAGNPGLWPAFWTLTSKGYKGHTTDSCDELDIIEAYPPWCNLYHVSRHEWNYGKLHTDYRVDPGVLAVAGATVCAFHTYGCLIERDTTRYYFDNVEIAGPKHATLPRTWEDGSYFMINDGLRNDFIHQGGGFTRYGNRGEMYVDWVRVYEAGGYR